MGTDLFFPESELTARTIKAFYRVYNQLGHGFLETVYCRALVHELTCAGIVVEREVPIDVWYNDIIAGQFRADVLVERKVIVEIKASQSLVEADWKQLLNYLHATRIELGLLLHFGPKPFFRRFIYSNSRKSHCE